MSADAEEISQLILGARRNLIPSSFPPRRDLDVAASQTGCALGITVFHDMFWPRRDHLACFVVRIDGGEAGSLLAHPLRALLRAALRHHPADRALALSLRALEQIGQARIDVAVATLAMTTREASLARHGAGDARLIAPGATPEDAGARLPEGGFCWLSVGPTAPEGPVLPQGEADALVREGLAGTHSTAAVAIGLRGVSVERGRTFVLANDVTEISPLLAEVEEHLLASGAGHEMLSGLDVAMDELLTNTMLYAYGDGQAHEIVVHVAVEDALLRIEIRDDGTPFDPTTVPVPDLEADLDDRPIGGLGLHFVRAVFDTVTYRRIEGWNVLRLTKPVPNSPSEASRT